MENTATDLSGLTKSVMALDFEALKQDSKQAFSDVCKFGDETVILSIDLNKKCTTYFGTPLGQEFISERKDLLEEFYHFCHETYTTSKSKEDLNSSGDVTDKRGATTLIETEDNPLSTLKIDLEKTNDNTSANYSGSENDITGSPENYIDKISEAQWNENLDPVTDDKTELPVKENDKQVNQLHEKKDTYSASFLLKNKKDKALESVSLDGKTPIKNLKTSLENSKRVTRSSANTQVEKDEGKGKKSSKKLLDSNSKVETKQSQRKSECEKKDSLNKKESRSKIEEETISKILTPERSSRKRQIKTPSWIQSYVVDGMSSKKKNEKSNENISNSKRKSEKSNRNDSKAKKKREESVEKQIIDDDDDVDDISEMELDDSENDADYVPNKKDIQEEESENSDNEKISTLKSPKLSNSKNTKSASKPGQELGKGPKMNDFKCFKCGVVFSWHKNLKRHLKTKHNISMEDNLKAKDDLLVQDSVNGQNKEEGDEKCFKCHECSSAFHWKKNLKVHMKRCHNIALDDVTKDFTEKGEGQTDGDNVRQRSFKCYTCKKGFYWKRNLISHLKRKHNLKLEDNVRPENYNSEEEEENDQCDDNGIGKDIQNQKGKGKFKCDYCKQIFHWKNNLRRHLMTRHEIGSEKLREIFLRITRETGVYAKSRTTWLSKDNENSSQDVLENVPTNLDCSSWMTVNLDNNNKIFVGDEKEDEMVNSKENVTDSTTEEPKRKTGSEFSFGDGIRRPFICKICNLAFKHRSNLWRHARHHSKTNLKKWKFSCPDCDKGFDSELALKSHLRSVHKKLNVFNCEKCKKSMHTITSYRKHVRLCNGDMQTQMVNESNNLTCCICLQVVKSQRTLDLHMKQHQNENPVCRICGKKFITSKRLELHMQIHTNDMKLPCYACGKQFNFPCNLGRHLQYTHKDKRPFCKKCAALFETENELKEHLKNEHKIAPNMCKYCGEVILDPNLLKKHKLIHKPSLVCEICGMTFERNGLLKEHLILHTDQYPLACDMCDRRFQLNKDLSKHRINDHGIKKCQCDECGRVFSLPQTLKKHLLTHTNIYSYPCKHCPRKFRSTDGLRYHMLLKHKGSDNIEDYKRKVFKCEHCGKLMGQKHVYERHTRMHTGEKPFVCSICNASFPVKARLNQHVKRHYSSKQYGCDVCNLEFWDQGSLKHHLQTRKHKEAERNVESNVIHIVQQPEETGGGGDQEIEIPMLIDGATKEYHVELVKPEPSEVQEVHQVMYETGGEIEVGVPYQVIQIPSNTPGAEQQYIYIRIPDTQGDAEAANVIYDVDTNSAVKSLLNTQ